MKTLIRFVKTTMIGGVVFLVPVVVITIIVGKALQLAHAVAKPLAAVVRIDTFAGVAVANILAGLIILLACLLAGLLARHSRISKFAQKYEERLLVRIPGYTLLKGVVDSLSGDNERASMCPVLLNLDDSSLMVFEIERLADNRVVIFAPSSPDPATGSVLVVQAERVEPLPISVGAALQNLRMAGRGTREFLGKAD